MDQLRNGDGLLVISRTQILICNIGDGLRNKLHGSIGQSEISAAGMLGLIPHITSPTAGTGIAGVIGTTADPWMFFGSRVQWADRAVPKRIGMHPTPHSRMIVAVIRSDINFAQQKSVGRPVVNFGKRACPTKVSENAG